MSIYLINEKGDKKGSEIIFSYLLHESKNYYLYLKKINITNLLKKEKLIKYTKTRTYLKDPSFYRFKKNKTCLNNDLLPTYTNIYVYPYSALDSKSSPKNE